MLSFGRVVRCVRGLGGHLWKIVERRLDRGGTVCSASDITESVAHEAMLEAARKAADRANATKSEFLTSMTHELRTPLNSIVGFTQLLKRDKKDPISKRHREWIEHVLHGCEHLMQLIDEVLDISCIESGKLSLCIEPVDITELFEEVVSTLSPLAGEAQIALVDGAHPSRPVGVLADRKRLSQILLNFGSNAIKYGRTGGRVTLGAEVFEGKIRLGVEDDGIGIAEEHQGKLFSPFFRAGQEGSQAPGSGMGLSISKRLAECMNGRVGFRSKPFEGSVFWVELPPCAAPPPGNR